MNRLTRGKVLVGGISVSTGDLVVAGDTRLDGIAAVTRSAATIADGASMVATAAHIMTNTIASATPTTARAVTTGTAVDIIALATNYTVGDVTEFTLISLAAYALTLTAGTGVTISGSAVCAASSSATWYVRIASSSTVVLYRK